MCLSLNPILLLWKMADSRTRAGNIQDEPRESWSDRKFTKPKHTNTHTHTGTHTCTHTGKVKRNEQQGHRSQLKELPKAKAWTI